MSTFVKLTAIVIGLIGLLALVLFQSILGCVLLPIGALLIMWMTIQERNDEKREQAEVEERRHREIVEAMRGTSQISGSRDTKRPDRPAPETDVQRQAREAREWLNKK